MAGESDNRTILAKGLEPGMALEVQPGVFWDVVGVEECGYYLNVELVHGCHARVDSEALVLVLDEEARGDVTTG